jgi:hypothetical protein
MLINKNKQQVENCSSVRAYTKKSSEFALSTKIAAKSEKLLLPLARAQSMCRVRTLCQDHILITQRLGSWQRR